MISQKAVKLQVVNSRSSGFPRKSPNRSVNIINNKQMKYEISALKTAC